MAFIHECGRSAARLVLGNRISSSMCRSFSQFSDPWPSALRTLRSDVSTSLMTPHLNYASQRGINTSTIFYQENDDEENEQEGAVNEDEKRRFFMINRKINDLDGNVRLPVRFHRVLEIPVEESIRYLQSEAYKNTYGDEPVWKKYRRNNFPGHYLQLPRKACIQGGVLYTGSACPICRDDYLVVDYRNVELLKQFISPQTGKQYFMKKTCVCQRAQRYLEVAIQRAKDTGLLVHDVKIRRYNYKDFYPSQLLDSKYQYIEK